MKKMYDILLVVDPWYLEVRHLAEYQLVAEPERYAVEDDCDQFLFETEFQRCQFVQKLCAIGCTDETLENALTFSRLSEYYKEGVDDN